MSKTIGLRAACAMILLAVGGPGRAEEPGKEDRAIFETIGRVKKVAGKVKIDGKRADWEGIPAFNDPKGDAGGDASRDIVKVAVAPREDDWLVMIATAGTPTRDNGAFYVEVDYFGHEPWDVQVGLLRGGACFLNVYDESNLTWTMGKLVPGVAFAIGNVVEVRIPHRALAEALPKPMAEALSGPGARSWVRVRGLTLGRQPGQIVDQGAAAASFRLIETPYPLDPPLPRDRKASKAIAMPVEGKWYVNQGAFGLYSHRDLWGYDLRKVDDAHRAARVIDREARRNDDYYAWDQPVTAPARGNVVRASNDAPDGDPRTDNTIASDPRVNEVNLDLGDRHVLWLGHLKQGSVAVAPGDRLKPGALLGAVGNSGQSSWPHLHLGLWRGAQTVPLAFSRVRVGLNNADSDPWARDLPRWDPREGFFVERIAAGKGPKPK
ncbi:MAG TPA: M23 family metallopeptidase [Isosphaeraceae bacterium]|jgi:hypothetical protein|nr:M23 family metallopeptidase [Isosphaeraceae bacterium]